MTKRIWSEEEKKIVREHYPNLDTKRLAEALPGRSAGAIHDIAGRLGVKKTPDRLREMGGQNTANKKAPQ
jgi:hypothetical protein